MTKKTSHVPKRESAFFNKVDPGEYEEYAPFDPVIFERINSDLKRGKTLTKACEKHGIRIDVIYFWLDQDETLRLNYQKSRKYMSETLVDHMIDDLEQDIPPEKVQARKLKVDSIKWLASKYNASQFGDRKQINIDGDIRHHAPLDLIDDQREKIAREWLMSLEQKREKQLLECESETSGPNRNRNK
jgi:hypothetical protein